jgi:aspartate aminotransferase
MSVASAAGRELADRISLISISSTMKVAADADRLRREGKDVVDFGAGEPDFPTPDNIKNAAIQAIHDNFTRYTPAGGTQDLKTAIVERHKLDYGTDYAPAECIVNVGGKHSIFNLTQALVNPGDEVIIPTPYWVTYKDVVNYAGGTCIFAPASEESGFVHTAEELEKYFTPRTKILLMNSPNNPSGGVLTKAEFAKIYELTKKHNVWLITDECYHRFLYEEKPFSIAAQPGAKDNVIVSGSLSKTYAMTGWRIGFTLGPKNVIDACMKLQSHSTSNPTSIAQKASLEALRGPQDSVAAMLAEYRKRRDYVVARLNQIPGVKAQMPKGAFYAYPNVSVVYGKDGITNSLDFANKLLNEALVAVVPGEAFGTNEHIRISYATSMEELDRGLTRIDQFIRARQ